MSRKRNKVSSVSFLTLDDDDDDDDDDEIAYFTVRWKTRKL